MSNRGTSKKAMELYVKPAEDLTLTAHKKLLQATGTDKLAILTLEEFDALRKQTVRLISGTGTCNESTSKLERIWEQLLPSETDMFSLKPDEVVTWCDVLWGQCVRVIHSSPFNKILMYWLTYESDTGEHPLDGQMDSNIDYESKVVYRSGMARWDYSESEGLAEQKAKEHFFHILATINKLEGLEHHREWAHLSYLDACVVMQCLHDNRPCRPDQAVLGAIIQAIGHKISYAIQDEKGINLTRDELKQVLLVLQRISRPKPKSLAESLKEPRDKGPLDKEPLTDPGLSQEQWELGIGMPRDQLARARYAETPKMTRDQHNDLGFLGKTYNLAVEKFDQQIANAKAEAEVKLGESEARYNELDAKYNNLRADYGHAKEEANRQFNKSKADIEKMHLKAVEDEDMIRKLKEHGRGEIQRSRDRAERYKSKYDEEVKNNFVMKLDYEAMSQMIEEMKAADKELAKISKADKLRITNLEAELGNLRTSRALPALDQRTTQELHQLRREYATLRKQFDALKEKNSIVEKESEETKTALAEMAAVQKATNIELNRLRANPPDKLTATTILREQVEYLQTKLAQKEHDVADLRKAATDVLEVNKELNTSLNTSRSLADSYIKGFVEEECKNARLQAKSYSITTAMAAALGAAANS